MIVAKKERIMKKKYNIQKIQDFSAILKEADRIKEERTVTLHGYRSDDGKSEVVLDLVSKEIKLRSQCADTQYIEIGGSLYFTKSIIKRNFGTWVEKNCPFSYRKADYLISLYKLCLEYPALTVLKKSALYYLSSGNCDNELRQGIAEAIQVISDITDSNHQLTLKEIRKIQVEYVNGNITPDDDSITEFIARQKKIKCYNRWKREGQKLLKMFEKKVNHFEMLLEQQRAVAGEEFENESTRYMVGIISILKETVGKISSLFQQDDNAQPITVDTSNKPLQLASPYIEAEFIDVNQGPGCNGLPVFKLAPDEYSNLDIAGSDLLRYYLTAQVPDYHDTNYCKHTDTVGTPFILVSDRYLECRVAGHASPKIKLLPPPAAQKPNRMPELKMLPAPPASTKEITALDTDTDGVSSGDNSAEQSIAHHRHIVDGDYRGITLEELLKEKFPDPAYIIKPIFRDPSISFIYAEQGVGKSWIINSISIALTMKNPEGITIGPWIVTQGCAVLYLDGEIPMPDFMRKISFQKKGMGPGDPDKPLTIWSSIQFDSEDGKMINLAEVEWRDRITQFFVINTQYKMLILDNLTSLTVGLNENVKQKWSPINQWLLRLRGMGVSIIIIDHANREGNLRGTNSKIDNINNNIFIEHDENYHIDTVAMIVQFKKGRDLKPGEGADVKLKLEGNSQEGLRLVQYS